MGFLIILISLSKLNMQLNVYLLVVFGVKYTDIAVI